MRLIILTWAQLFLLGIFSTLNAQIKDIGLPFTKNYSRDDYNAETQNWSITQDEQGIMYFANNLGVLAYNGNRWSTFPLPNNSIVRSVSYINKRIYAGGFNEFGYFEKNNRGDLIYYSLSELLPERNKNFDEVWRIFPTSQGIIFQTYLDVFIYDNGAIKVLEPKSRFGFSYKIDDKIYLVDREFGLYTITDKKLVPVLLEDDFFVKNEISFILPDNEGNLLLGTTNNGIFKLKNKKLTSWEIPLNDFFIQNQIYTGISLNTTQIAIGTIQNGVSIINLDGEMVMQVNRRRGLQNNTVLSLFYDMHKNLWLGLDNGIDMLELNTPVTILNYSYNIETSYTSIVHNNILYVGTNQGLFAKELKKLSNEYLINKGFEIIDGTLGQVWKLKVVDGILLCGHNFGTFVIKDKKAKLISNIPGGWDFIQIPWNKQYMICGNYSGINLFKKDNQLNTWKELGMVTGYNESSKDLMFGKNKNLWVSHGLKGLFKLKLSSDLRHVDEFFEYNDSHGLPEIPYSLVKIKEKTLILGNDTLYQYSPNNKFIVNTEYTSLFGNINGLTKIIEDKYGDIWFFTSSKMGVFRLLEDGNYTVITKPFMRIHKLFIRGSFENIFSYNSNNVFIGSQEGMLHYTSETQKNFDLHYSAYFSKIRVRGRHADTSKISERNEMDIHIEQPEKEIPYRFNSISFNYFAPFYEATNEVLYAYRLNGYDDQWSGWAKSNYKEYTNLREGEYTFEVKAINIYNNESKVAKYNFTIKPPFYRTTLAYSLYLGIFLLVVAVNIIYYQHKIEKTRKIENQKLIVTEKKFKEEVKQSEEKIEKLEQEKLKGDMRHKNMELANSTMSLIQKNKFLNKLKQELVTVSDKARSNAVKLDIKQIITRIDKDLNNEQNLKVFDKYFDQVHQDFIKRLKEEHPSLTPKDIRLCAYLRMNLSTKEIAPLMNVSVRGLEISRYRLRKKLDLDHKENLVDYILKV